MADRYEIRNSDTQDIYILLKIDAENNETLIEQSSDLKELQNHKEVAGKKVPVVDEADTRGTVEPPKQPKLKRKK